MNKVDNRNYFENNYKIPKKNNNILLDINNSIAFAGMSLVIIGTRCYRRCVYNYNRSVIYLECIRRPIRHRRGFMIILEIRH